VRLEAHRLSPFDPRRRPRTAAPRGENARPAHGRVTAVSHTLLAFVTRGKNLLRLEIPSRQAGMFWCWEAQVFVIYMRGAK